MQNPIITPYIPYSGSKQRIREQIVKTIKTKCPSQDTAIDLFGGGGAMSFEFLQQGYKKVVYNEINKGYYTLLLFLKKRRQYCLDNNLPLTLPDYFYNFVDKTNYGNVKMQDDNVLSEVQLAYKYFILACYTFNNLQKGSRSGYLYGISKSDANYYVHRALVFKDKNALQQIKNHFAILGNLVSVFDCCLQNNLQNAIYDFNRYTLIITYLFDNLRKKPNITPIISRLNEEFAKDNNYFNTHPQADLCRLLLLYGLKPKGARMSCSEFINNGTFACDHLQRLLHIQAILQLPLENLDLYNLNYAIFPFEKYSNFIVYADPPYFSTVGYDSGDFDFSRFSGFCYNFQRPLFVSEITNPNPNRLQNIWSRIIKDNVSTKALRKEQLFYNHFI